MDWTFADNIPQRRRGRLVSPPTYLDIVKAMVDEARQITPWVESGIRNGDRPDLSGCHRPSFRFRVKRETGDLFFNSCSGYRAAYCRSAAMGARANRLVISALKSRLREAWGEHNACGFDANWVDRALDHHSAKVWVDEQCLDVNSWTDLKIEVRNPVWVNTANAYQRNIDQLGLEGEVSFRIQREEPRLPYWGLRAPVCEWLQFKGAWIGPNGDCQIGKPPDKRAAEICKQGWS